MLDKLRFTPYAWAKMVYLRDKGDTEVSFFAITRSADLGLVIDLQMPKQIDSAAFTEFKEEELVDFFEDMVEQGFQPEEFARIWCHTHPGASASPSGQDEETFKKEFAAPNWAIMFILGKTDKPFENKFSITCRLKCKNHPELAHVIGSHVSKDIPVEVDYGADSYAVDSGARAAWDAEYLENWERRTYSGGYSNNWNQNNWQRSNHSEYKTWREQTDEFVYGPGWYKSGQSWCYNSTKRDEHLAAGHTVVSPDYAKELEEKKKAEGTTISSETFRGGSTDSEKGKSPIGYYRPETSHNGKLTKRERKYLKRNGTLKGFVPPENTGVKPKPLVEGKPQLDFDQLEEEDWKARWEERAEKVLGNSYIPVQKLETNRNLLFEQASEEVAPPKTQTRSAVLENYTVLLEDKVTKITNVWAHSAEDAIEMVNTRMNLHPAQGSNEPTDEDLARIDEEMALLDDEEFDLVPLDDDDTALEGEFDLIEQGHQGTNEGLANFSLHEREASGTDDLLNDWPARKTHEAYDVLG